MIPILPQILLSHRLQKSWLQNPTIAEEPYLLSGIRNTMGMNYN